MTDPDNKNNWKIQKYEGIAAIDSQLWDGLAKSADFSHPFISHGFLSSLELAHCVGPESGWIPQPLILYNQEGQAIAGMPLYIKLHSHGEYIFDWQIAQSYERYFNQAYYPKLLCAIPFTPVPGGRILTSAHDQDGIHAQQAALLSGAIDLANQYQCSGFHVNFLANGVAEKLTQSKETEYHFSLRNGHQYHWYNRGFHSFDDFLDSLQSRKRKMIKKERDAVKDAGVRVHILEGSDISTADWRAFYQFYRDTYDRKWGAPYLNESFFQLITEKLGDQVVLIMAEKDGAWIAGALNMIGEDALYGRNWGCFIDIPFLHFELCYYQAIEFAIERKLKRVEAGTQGEHKIARGYTPVKTSSIHWYRDIEFHQAINQFHQDEREQIDHVMSLVAKHSPYKNL